MKKVLFISLLLVAVFLIASSGVASAVCFNYQDYTCKGHASHNGKFDGYRSDCVELCFDGPFFVTISNSSPSWFVGTLYPALDYENLLGTFDGKHMSGGISVEFSSRRSIRMMLSYIEEAAGYVDVFDCTLTPVCM